MPDSSLKLKASVATTGTRTLGSEAGIAARLTERARASVGVENLGSLVEPGAARLVMDEIQAMPPPTASRRPRPAKNRERAMSKGFVREQDGEETFEELPDRPVSA